MAVAAGREGRCNTGIYSEVVFGPRMRGRTDNWARRPAEQGYVARERDYCY
jgi:hypothetical protein